MKINSVAVKVLTGDNVRVTTKVYRDVGLDHTDTVLGSDIDHVECIYSWASCCTMRTTSCRSIAIMEQCMVIPSINASSAIAAVDEKCRAST